MNEWTFDQTCDNSVELTFRCICFTMVTDNDELTPSELDLINRMVDCLNKHYREDDEQEGD